MAPLSAFSAYEECHDKMLLPDFCNQHVLHALVEAFDSRAWGFRRHRPTPRAVTPSFRRVTLTHGRRCTALQHRFLSVATLRMGAAPGRCAFDDAHRASGLLPTIPSFFEGAENRSGRCSRAAALSTACTVELQTPLSFSVAPLSPDKPAASAPRVIPLAPSSKESKPLKDPE